MEADAQREDWRVIEHQGPKPQIFRQMPADIAIDWHKHELNVRPDRRLDKWALAISGLSFAVSAITPFKPFG
jgi:hypothetical protein